jgi:hypothetical protein
LPDAFKHALLRPFEIVNAAIQLGPLTAGHAIFQLAVYTRAIVQPLRYPLCPIGLCSSFVTVRVTWVVSNGGSGGERFDFRRFSEQLLQPSSNLGAVFIAVPGRAAKACSYRGKQFLQ